MTQIALALVLATFLTAPIHARQVCTQDWKLKAIVEAQPLERTVTVSGPARFRDHKVRFKDSVPEQFRHQKFLVAIGTETAEKRLEIHISGPRANEEARGINGNYGLARVCIEP
jgi:hypothetical protein